MPTFIFVPVIDHPDCWPANIEAARDRVKTAVSSGTAHTVITRNDCGINLAALRAADAVYWKFSADQLECTWPMSFLAVDDTGVFWQVAIDLEIEPNFFTHREAEKLFQKGE